jgi:hypothetical protein
VSVDIIYLQVCENQRNKEPQQRIEPPNNERTVCVNERHVPASTCKAKRRPTVGGVGSGSTGNGIGNGANEDGGGGCVMRKNCCCCCWIMVIILGGG